MNIMKENNNNISMKIVMKKEIILMKESQIIMKNDWSNMAKENINDDEKIIIWLMMKKWRSNVWRK